MRDHLSAASLVISLLDRWADDMPVEKKLAAMVRFVEARDKELLQENTCIATAAPVGANIPAGYSNIDDHDAFSFGDIPYMVLFGPVDPSNKIEAIKIIRQVTKWGLKECKDFVENLPSKNGLRRLHNNIVYFDPDSRVYERMEAAQGLSRCGLMVSLSK